MKPLISEDRVTELALICLQGDYRPGDTHTSEIKRAIRTAIKEAAEECAKEAYGRIHGLTLSAANPPYERGYNAACTEITAAIRSRIRDDRSRVG